MLMSKRSRPTLCLYERYSGCWCLFVGIALAAYVYSLNASTAVAYLTFAMSSFGEHSLLSSITLVESLITIVGKPVIAKVADVSPLGSAFIGAVSFYVFGQIAMASAQNVGAIAGGIVLYSIGHTGLQILTQILIADITTLRWRGLVVSLVPAPFVINAFIGSNISTSVIDHTGWRWGYGIFAILAPVALSPLIITLLWAEHKMRRLNLVKSKGAFSDSFQDITNETDKGTSSKGTLSRRLQRVVVKLDVVGLIFLGTAVSLILLPLTLSETMTGGWKNASVISMLVVGVLLLFVFAYWDFHAATQPVIAPRLLRNKNVVFASMIGFFNSLIYSLTFAYLYSFVLVIKPWSLIDSTYFLHSQGVALSLFGVLAGVAMKFLRRFKYILVFGLIIRLVGVAMMIHSRAANGSTVELVFTQILQGFGDGFITISALVSAQAVAPHVDVAVTTALFLFLSDIGGAVGNACAGAIWTNTMPGNLKKYLPSLTDARRAELYGSITSVTRLSYDNPVRQGVIQAYEDTMMDLILCATGLSVFVVILSLGIPDVHLGDTQNAVETSDQTGCPSTTEEGIAAK